MTDQSPHLPLPPILFPRRLSESTHPRREIPVRLRPDQSRWGWYIFRSGFQGSVFPPDYSKGYAGDRPDSSQEWWFVWEEVPVVGRKRTRPLGYQYEPWNWGGAESDGVGEENERRRDQATTLTTRAPRWLNRVSTPGYFLLTRGLRNNRNSLVGMPGGAGNPNLRPLKQILQPLVRLFHPALTRHFLFFCIATHDSFLV